MILPLLLSCALTVAQVDTLSTSVVTASVKRQLETEELATPVTSLALKQIEASGIEAPKGLSGKIPEHFHNLILFSIKFHCNQYNLNNENLNKT